MNFLTFGSWKLVGPPCTIRKCSTTYNHFVGPIYHIHIRQWWQGFFHEGIVMAEVSTIVGITFMVIGSLLVSLGLFLCYTTKVCKTFFTFFSLMDTFSIACNKSVQRLPANVVMQGSSSSRRNVSKKGSVRGAPQQCAKKKKLTF